MLEWIAVVMAIFSFFPNRSYNQPVYYVQPQAQVYPYQYQSPQIMASPYGPQGGYQGYYYGQPPQAYAYPQGY
jgi:hypothetical protein